MGPFEGHDHQKLGLLLYLLQLGMWDVAQDFMRRIGTDEYAVDVASHPPIASALLALADAVIAPTVSASLDSHADTGLPNRKCKGGVAGKQPQNSLTRVLKVFLMTIIPFPCKTIYLMCVW